MPKCTWVSRAGRDIFRIKSYEKAYGFSTHDVQGLCSLPSGSILGEESTMRVQLAQQAQNLLGQSDLGIITERVDEVALLIGQMVTMGFVEVLDRPLPRHGKQRRGSW